MDTQQQSPNPNRPSNSAPDQQAMCPAGYSQEQEVSQPRPDIDAERKKEPNGGRGGRGSRKNKRKDLGRKAWSRQIPDKRARAEASQESKRRKLENGEKVLPIYATEFSKEDIEADQRRPKKKVAVMLGYSGSGYKGMQLSETEKTIEGDLFTAFVAAGAISKANATDPKKSSLVRCARTDKGVHAAGNVVSLKLIVEDPNVVQKINEHLSPQIRVWGIEITNKSFSSYHLCDSRIYEYLIPSHCFLPPHPSTHLGQQLVEIAEQENDLEGYQQRQAEVAHYWEEVDEKYIKPILERLPEVTRNRVKQALIVKSGNGPADNSTSQREQDQLDPSDQQDGAATSKEASASTNEKKDLSSGDAQTVPTTNEAIRMIRAAYLDAKKAYRIPTERMDRINDALGMFVGTRNFHNYTIQKSSRDASAKRHIKSFKISREPLIINGTEWLSLKVHGQSFMMHQIRKMVAMAALIVRCGCDIQLVPETYGDQKIAIPKAPGLGLLLERPIFDSYNKRTVVEYGKNPIDFSKYEKEIEEFKQREIYERIFREEEESNSFGNFFNHIDTFQDNAFLFVTSRGIPASKPSGGSAKAPMSGKAALKEVESESEDDLVNGGEEGG
ncbi:tRNA pseudouridine synthase [Histoplasma ohiense]|nr:tRNA pseudouridine synthase [Histoplasma ohiense (nom. inval.)]